LFEEVGDRRRQQCWKELHPASNGIQMLPSSSRPDYYVPKVFGSFIVDVEIGTLEYNVTTLRFGIRLCGLVQKGNVVIRSMVHTYSKGNHITKVQVKRKSIVHCVVCIKFRSMSNDNDAEYRAYMLY
jgi:hypothetical protein